MKYLLISLLTLIGLNTVANNEVQEVSATIMNKMAEKGVFDNLNDTQLDEVQNQLELSLNEQNGEYLLFGLLDSLGGKLSDLLKGAKAGFKTAADLVKRGLGKAAAFAESLGVTDIIKEIPATVAELGADAVIEFIKAMVSPKP